MNTSTVVALCFTSSVLAAFISAIVVKIWLQKEFTKICKLISAELSTILKPKEKS
jgi:hypothetical protein